MPNAGLAEAGRDLLWAAVADEATAARFRAHTVQVPGFGCPILWSGAVSAGGTDGSGSPASPAATSS
jgi:hypothetical protein